MTETLIIKGNLPTMNKILNFAKNPRGKYAMYRKMKKELTERIAWEAEIQGFSVGFMFPVDFLFHWYWKDKRTDKDNIVSCQKFIFDGLQEAGVIPNDNWAYVGDLVHRFSIDKDNPRVEVSKYYNDRFVLQMVEEEKPQEDYGLELWESVKNEGRK